MIQIDAIKGNRREGGEERPSIWWPMEDSMFGNLWKESNTWRSMGKHPCLVAFGRRNRSIFFTSSDFSPQKILLKPFFPLILKFCFTTVLDRYFASFLPFP